MKLYKVKIIEKDGKYYVKRYGFLLSIFNFFNGPTSRIFLSNGCLYGAKWLSQISRYTSFDSMEKAKTAYENHLKEEYEEKHKNEGTTVLKLK